MDSNLGALCRVGCKNIIRTLPGGEEVGETGNTVEMVNMVWMVHNHMVWRGGII